MAEWLRLRWGNVPKAFKNVSGIYADNSGNLKVRNPDGTSSDLGGGGASAGIELIGPFAATFQSPQIGGNGYLLTTLDPSQIIFAVYVFVSSSWANDGGLYIYLGDPNVNPINLWVNAGVKNTSYASIPPADGGLAAGIAADQSFATDSGVYIQCSNSVSAGASDIYLLVSTPT